MKKPKTSEPHAEAVAVLAARDSRLSAIIDRVGPCLLARKDGTRARADGHFEGLVVSIVSQQLSSKAADTIWGRVRALTGDAFDPPSLFALPETSLRAAGLSNAKARYVRGLCERVISGALDLGALDSLDDEAVIEALTAVKGIGRWTAEMVLMFRLGRLDVLPVDDLGIRKGFQRLFRMRDLPTKEKMEKLAKPWQPYRSIACWYLWRLNDLPPELKSPRRSPSA